MTLTLPVAAAARALAQAACGLDWNKNDASFPAHLRGRVIAVVAVMHDMADAMGRENPPPEGEGTIASSGCPDTSFLSPLGGGLRRGLEGEGTGGPGWAAVEAQP